MRRALVVAGLVVVLGVSNALIVEKEQLLADGQPILLELAPVDPRSLIQGDYMTLDYAIARQLGDSARTWPRTGEIVVRVDSLGVARYVRRHRATGLLQPGERLLTYRRHHGRVQVGTDAFHFQEGHASRYSGARYGELRASRSGTTVLVGLRDSALKRLGTPMPRRR